MRRDAEELEEVCLRGDLGYGFGRVGAAGIHDDGPGIQAHVAEGGVLRAPIEVILSGEGILAGRGLGLAQLDELFGVRVRKRLAQGGVHDGENGSVGADSESERDNGDQREGGISRQRSCGVAQILHRVLQPVDAAHVPTLLFALLEATKIPARGAGRFFPAHPASKVFFDLSLKEVLQLFAEFPLNAVALEERAQPQENGVEPMFEAHGALLATRSVARRKADPSLGSG